MGDLAAIPDVGPGTDSHAKLELRAAAAKCASVQRPGAPGSSFDHCRGNEQMPQRRQVPTRDPATARPELEEEPGLPVPTGDPRRTRCGPTVRWQARDSVVALSSGTGRRSVERCPASSAHTSSGAKRPTRTSASGAARSSRASANRRATAAIVAVELRPDSANVRPEPLVPCGSAADS
jgi:hypothetical protein